jgi:dipeptidyl aminopeptidase/acylaminoacyl peptidase
MRKNQFLYVACAIILIGLICVLPTAAMATEKIVFSSTRDGSPGLYVINPDGTDLARLPDNTSYKIGPEWSPDGSKVAFLSYRDGNREIYVMNADGTGQTRLTNNTMIKVNPAWSPDGSRIAFGLRYGRYNCGIDVMNADGTNLIRVTNGSFFDGAPVWSPDGSLIAFDSYRYGQMPEGTRQIYVIKPDGTDLARLTPFTENAHGPLWSLDGSRIAFSSYQNGLSEINVDGTGETRLTENMYYYPDREWSSDRSLITFTLKNQGDNYPGLYVMNADGTGRIRLTDNASDPGWGLDFTVPAAPIANLTANLTSGKAPLTVQFTDTSSETPTRWAWTFGDGATSTERNPVHTYTAAGIYTVGLTVTNTAGSNTTSKIGLVRVTADSIPPIITNLDACPNPVAINKQVVLTATVNDKKAGRSGIASTDYSLDNAGWLPMKVRDGSFGEKSEQVTITLPGFASAGVHTIRVRATDTAGNTGEYSKSLSLTVYDPNSGSVMGDGWIVSPKGALISDRSKTGKATFDFNAKDQKGVPRGQIEFQFKSAGFTFKSDNVDSLVVTGSRAQFKGVGTVNGRGAYAFMVTTTDGGKGGGSADKFRIKIWDQKTGATIYDNQLNASDTSDPTTVIGGGSIVIHR